MNKCIFMFTMFILLVGCTTYNDYRDPGMNEIDKQMYDEGWHQEYIGNNTSPVYIKGE